MNNEVMRQAMRTDPVLFSDKAVAKEAKNIVAKAWLARIEADGVMALAGHIMEGLTLLDLHRQALSDGIQGRNMILGEIELNAIRALGQIQRNHAGDGSY